MSLSEEDGEVIRNVVLAAKYTEERRQAEGCTEHTNVGKIPSITLGESDLYWPLYAFGAAVGEKLECLLIGSSGS